MELLTHRRRGVTVRVADSVDSAISTVRRRAGRPLTRLQVWLRRVADTAEPTDQASIEHHLAMMEFGDDVVTPPGVVERIDKMREHPVPTP